MMLSAELSVYLLLLLEYLLLEEIVFVLLLLQELEVANELLLLVMFLLTELPLLVIVVNYTIDDHWPLWRRICNHRIALKLNKTKF
jgi:hypothetical protein